MCHSSNLYHVFNNNYSFVYVSTYSLLLSHDYTSFVSANLYALDLHNSELQARNLS